MTAAGTVRLASLADLQALLAIERVCPETSHWSEAVWRGVLQPSASEGSARAVWIAETHEGASGFAVAHCVAGSAELENLAVRPECRRRGLARALCHHAMKWAAVHAAAQRGALVTGVTTEPAAMHLEVRAGNRAALQLYAALGFLEQGRRNGYYQDPLDDAVLMTRRFG